jgi:DNA-binding CsgD family transcriptional regulator
LEDVFVGRGPELSRFAQIMDRVRQGHPWLVTVEGEPGIGKTALVRRCVASTGTRALWARSDPIESDVEYGVVEQLVRRVEPGVLRRYPLLVGGTQVPPSSFAVGAELLGVVGDLQSDGPVLMVIDDVQWADRGSVEALAFMLRRLAVDQVLVVVIVRRDGSPLSEPTARMLESVDQRLRLSLSGLRIDDVTPLAAALGAPELRPDVIQRLYDSTGGNTLYLQTVLSDREGLERLGPEQVPVPESLAAAIADQLASMPAETRSLLEALAVLNLRMPLALLGDAARVVSPSSAIEPAVKAGLVEWWPQEPSCPVVLRHALQRDAIYAGLPAARRRELHARAITLVDEGASWTHRVAALDCPDDELAAQLEHLAAEDAARGQLAQAATHLQWASDISTARPDRERRVLTAAIHLMLVDEARGLGLRSVVELSAPSAWRRCALGAMAVASGQLGEAERHLVGALAETKADPGSHGLAATIALRLAFAYALLGAGEKMIELSRWAIASGKLDPAAESRARGLLSVGVSHVRGPRAALAELAHLNPDPARVEVVDIDALAFRGFAHLLAGDLAEAIGDLSASHRLARKGAPFALGARAYFYLSFAQYLTGAWDDAVLTAEQGLMANEIHPRRYELPVLHLAAACVPAGRGATEEAERHAHLATEAANDLEYRQERLYSAMARAFVGQGAGDYPSMVDALGYWQDEAGLDHRSRLCGVLWRPLLVEGLVGSGRWEEADVALAALHEQADEVGYLQPALAWLDGWLAEERGAPQAAREIYEAAEQNASTACPVYTARLLLANGRLLRRTSQRRLAVERLRRAHQLYISLRAQPFIAQTEAELAACGLSQEPAQKRSVLEMTRRESEVARLVAERMTNNEIAAELFITPTTVEYHLGNIYAKFGVKGRQQLRRVLAMGPQPLSV